MGQADRDYLLARAEQERARAGETSDEIVRAIHLKLAHEYSVRAHRGDDAPGGDNDVLGGASSRLTLL